MSIGSAGELTAGDMNLCSEFASYTILGREHNFPGTWFSQL